MKFKATETQVQEIALNAIEWSNPLRRLDVASNTIPLNEEGLFVDYFQSRRVKLWIWRKESLSDGRFVWEIKDNVISTYQTWLGRYKTIEKLIRSVLGNNEEVVIRDEHD